MELVFATNNTHKLVEIRHILGDRFRILGLGDLQIREEIPEDHDTLEENALQKAKFIHDRTGKDCFADDTGLEVDALDGAPGVYSARYSQMGDPVFPHMEPAAGNIKKLLLVMNGETRRTARFRTVIALIAGGKDYLFEGIIEGKIGREPRGEQGFGYDPIFVPDGYTQTFAQMDLQEKNRISHRSLAVGKLADFLRKM